MSAITTVASLLCLITLGVTTKQTSAEQDYHECRVERGYQSMVITTFTNESYTVNTKEPAGEIVLTRIFLGPIKIYSRLTGLENCMSIGLTTWTDGPLTIARMELCKNSDTVSNPSKILWNNNPSVEYEKTGSTHTATVKENGISLSVGDGAIVLRLPKDGSYNLEANSGLCGQQLDELDSRVERLYEARDDDALLVTVLPLLDV